MTQFDILVYLTMDNT